MRTRYLIVGLVLAAAVAATTAVYRQEVEAIHAAARDVFQARADLIRQYLVLMRHNVSALQHAIEDEYREVDRTGAIAREVSAIRYFPGYGVWGISGLASEGGIAELSGSLTGLHPLRNPTPAVKRELTAVLDTDGQFQDLIEDVPGIAWVYYTSVNDFIYIAPDPPVADSRYSRVLMTKRFWVEAAPRHNPGLRQIISDLYDDYYGKGLMISISSPVVHDGRFTGVVSLDLGIDLLRNLTEVGSAPGESILVGENGRIVARAGSFDIGERYDVPLRGGWIGDVDGADWLAAEVAQGELRLLHRLPHDALRWAAIRRGGLFWVLFAATLALFAFSLRLSDALSRVRFLMNRDTLTDLLNRRGFTASVEPLRELARHDGRRTALLLLDIDHFKDVNDSHGHAAGDEVLSALAQRLSVGVKEYDLVCRWGGEELLVFLIYDHPATLLQIAERLRRSIGERPVSARELDVTISGGLTDWTWEEPLRTAVDRADRLLYQAKAAGRDRIVSDVQVPGQGAPLRRAARA